MERRKSPAGKVFLKKREKGKKHWKILKLFVSDSGRERIMLFLIPKSGNPVPKPSFRRPPSFPPPPSPLFVLLQKNIRVFSSRIRSRRVVKRLNM